MLAPELEKKISQLIEDHIPTAFLVDIQLKRGKKQLLSIKVDKDGGISLAECSTISRMLGRVLEDEPNFDTAYTLEVSSPGVGFPLKLHRQYVNNIGRQLSVKCVDDITKEGELKQVEEDFIILGPLLKKQKKGKKKKSTEEALPDRKIFFNEILESKVIIV